ncbi:MAG: TIGR02147 family protein [Bacteriovoracia bacterium]
MAAPTVYDYWSHRDFLQDYLKSPQALALNTLAAAADVSHSYLSRILGGTRKINAEQLARIARRLGLDERETAYLLQLREYADSKDQLRKREAFQAMQNLWGFRKNHGDDERTFRYLSRWYYPVIREMANLPGFSLDPHWICARLQHKVGLNEIQSALNFLVEHGLIVPREGGGYTSSQEHIVRGGPAYRISMAEYYEKTWALGARSILENESNERHTLSHTIGISESGYRRIVAILEKSLGEAVAIGQEDSSGESPERVIHVGLMAFPLAHLTPKRKVTKRKRQ